MRCTCGCVVPGVDFGGDVVATDVTAEIEACWLVIRKLAVHFARAG